MPRTVLAAVLLWAALTPPAHSASPSQSSFNYDIWNVRELYQELRAADFAERERATERLIAVGPAVLPLLDETIGEYGLSAEQRERVERIRREAPFGHLHTLDGLLSEHERLQLEMLRRDAERERPRILALRAQSELLLGRAELLLSPDAADRRLGLLRVACAERFYRLPSPLWLEFAALDLSDGLARIDSALDAAASARRPASAEQELRARRDRASELLAAVLWSFVER